MMRKTRLNQASITVSVALVCTAVLLALVRTFLIQPAAPSAREGAELFKRKGCVQCHLTDSRETKFGPGLKGLFERDKLPVSGRKVTEENVRRQLKTPYNMMPSFADRLTAEERDHLILYLKKL